MVAVQFDRSGGSVAPVASPPRVRAVDRRGAELRSRSLRRRAERWSHEQATDVTPETEDHWAEDHWADGARVQLAMVGVAFGL